MRDEMYNSVNAALNDYFFRGHFEMMPVYLDLEGDAELAVSKALDVAPAKLGDIIGLSAARSLRFDIGDPYADQLKWLKSWRDNGFQNHPPFTVLLCALSIAAERMGSDEEFSPNNYYMRLFETLKITEVDFQKKLKTNARSTKKFWHALEMWLSENDYLFGRPTAYAVIPSWKYAGYALSQALIRDADRNRFISLFETFDLNPGESISDAEMELYIDLWMNMSGSRGPTSFLRNLWGRDALKHRIVTAALDRHEIWDKSRSKVNDSPKKAKLLLQLGFSGFPRIHARLFLVVIQGGQKETLIPDSVNENSEIQLFLESGFEPGVHFLGPASSIDLALFLPQSCQFTGADSEITYNYQARPIIPLSLSQDGPIYNEVSRVSLFKEHAVLCHKNWLEKVKEHLSKCARPGYEVFCSNSMPGIPEDWYIVRKVKVVQLINDVSDDLHALNPVASTIEVNCIEGLKLGFDIWHKDACPMIQVTSGGPSYTVDIVEKRFDQEEKVYVSIKEDGGFREIDISTAEISTKANLRAIVKSQGTKKQKEFSISLRSADAPRPFNKSRISHSVDTQGVFVCGTSQTEMDSQLYLEGCFLNGDFDALPTGAAMPSHIVSSSYTVPYGNPEASPSPDWQLSGETVQQAAKNCVIRGYHYWIVEPFEQGDSRFTPKKAKCKNCNEETSFRISRTPTSPKQQNAITESTSKLNVSAATSTLIPVDTVYDGLCYFGQGTWQLFQRLASVASQEPWFAHSLAADLFALGHLETPNIFQALISDWSIPPPVLVVGADGNGYLSGFHSKSLLDRIDMALTRENARYETVSVPGQVSVHRWSKLAKLDLCALLDGIKDPHGRPVTAACGIGRVIARHLPSLDKAWSVAPPLHIENADLAKFNVSPPRWTCVDRLEGQGAYRVGLHGTRYVYCDPNGSTRQVGHRTAKILAAQAEGVRLHMYDPATGRFTATLGAEPPGLFARAIVASSGMLPTNEGNGRLVYENVEEDVAAEVLFKMYGKDKSHE